jgi:hypothetical protein
MCDSNKLIQGTSGDIDQVDLFLRFGDASQTVNYQIMIYFEMLP